MWAPNFAGVRRNMLLTTVVVAAILISSCSGQDQRIIASYEGGEVTAQEFVDFKNTMDFFNPSSSELQDEETILRQYIAIKAISERVDEKTQQQQQQKTNEQFEEMKSDAQSQLGRNEWNKRLKDVGISESGIKKYLEHFNLVEAAYAEEVDDAAVEAEYERLKIEHAFDLVSLRHLMISTYHPESNESIRTMDEALSLAEDIKGRLDQGEDFAELAAAHSDDQGTSQTGGLIPERSVNGFVLPEFRQALIDLPVNAISDPIGSDAGFHILRIESKRTIALEEFDDQMMEQLEASLINRFLTEFIEHELPDMIQQIEL